MPLLEVTKIYKSKEEIEEYKKILKECENLKFIGNCLWDFDFQQILEKKKLKKLRAVEKAFGLLEDLTPEEWEQFKETTSRQPLFKKRYK